MGYRLLIKNISAVCLLVVPVLVGCSAEQDEISVEQESKNRITPEKTGAEVSEEKARMDSDVEEKVTLSSNPEQLQVPDIKSLFDNYIYVHQPLEGVYHGKTLVVIGGDEPDRYSIKVVDSETLNVETIISTCCDNGADNFVPRQVYATPQGGLYVNGEGGVYFSADSGSTWEQLGPIGGDQSTDLEFMSIIEARKGKSKISNRFPSYWRHVSVVGVDAKGNAVVLSGYSGGHLGVIDPETGAVSLKEHNFEKLYNMQVAQDFVVTRSGTIYFNGKVNDGKDYPWLTMRSDDGGVSFHDITRGGEATFRGVSWRDDVLMRDHTFKGGYSLNGKLAGRALSTGRTSSDSYYMLPNGVIARIDEFFMEYSLDGGVTVHPFRTPDRQTIIDPNDGWGDSLFY